ncbi:MAG: hypothetical protein L3J28_14805 [Candidatus Polarisedimenticolaceae bacterium]|nr:hypothetical protein [Candidatus Polarisedimenticolaceae bacterium]
MKALINYFFDLCLLRVKPQDLPASQALLSITFILNVLVGLLLIGDVRPHPAAALLESFIGASLLLITLKGMLYLRQIEARFIQSATALMGSGLILSLIALPLLVLAGNGGEPTLAGTLLLLLVMWSIIILAHILRHTFTLPLPLAISFGLLYTFFSYAVMANIFQVS